MSVMKIWPFIIAAGLSATLAPEALASCDLSVQSRPATLANYVEAGQACLSSLPDGYAIDETMEADFLERVNEARLAHRLPALKLRPQLTPAARWHSLDMAANSFFAHQGDDQRSASQRITAFDRTLLSSVQRENIAAIRGPFRRETIVERLHAGLMDSESHRQAILAEDISHIGLGVITRTNGVWVTQLFVRKDGEFSQPVPLQAHAGTEIRQAVSLKDWEASGLALRKDEKTTQVGREENLSGRIPASMRGPHSLTVRGKKPGPSADTCLYIYFTGPRMEIVTPSSS